MVRSIRYEYPFYDLIVVSKSQKNKTSQGLQEGISELPEEINDTDEISGHIKRAPNKESYCYMNPSSINAPE
jgi:hypothetical protein